MKKTIFLILIAGVFSSGKSQVQVNVSDADVQSSAMLQVGAGTAATKKGMSFPNIALTSKTDNTTIASPATGLVVYNITNNNNISEGYFYWNGSSWLQIGTINTNVVFKQKIHTNELGYVPTSTTDNGTALASGYALIGCVKWNEADGGNGHTYCAYSTPNVDWQTAYSFAKNRGGYLLTLTANNETAWVNTNVLGTYNLNSNIWLGYSRIYNKFIPTSGNGSYSNHHNGYRFEWITGEKQAINWESSGTTGAVPQHNFSSGEPNATQSNDACVYITTATGRKWDDTSCTATSGRTNLVVEFQDSY